MTTDRRKRLTLAACILASAIVFLDTNVVNVALPAIRRDLHAGLATEQWVVEAYLLALASLLLVGGALSDRRGRRRVFMAGVGGFGAASVVCATAPDAAWLVAGRGLQGVAGALLVPASLATVTGTFGPGERGRAIGAWTAYSGAVVALGLLAGGALVSAGSWRLVFALNLPLVVAALGLIVSSVPETAERTRRGVDLVGALLCALGLGGLVSGLIAEPRLGFGHPAVIAGLIGGVALLLAFAAHERRCAAPMLPLELFGARAFTVGNVTTFGVYAGLGAATFLVAVFVEQVDGYSAVQAGLTLLPVTVAMVTLSRLWAAVAERVGPRAPMAIGPLVAAAGLALTLRVGRHPDYMTDLLPALALFGLGMSITVAPLTAAVLGAVQRGHAGVASGINNAVARVGGLLAIALVGAVVAARSRAVLAGGPAARPSAPGVRAALAHAAADPLGGAGAAHGAASRAIDAAAVSGFHLGMALAAAPLTCGGLASAVGLRHTTERRAPMGAVAPPAPVRHP